MLKVVGLLAIVFMATVAVSPWVIFFGGKMSWFTYSLIVGASCLLAGLLAVGILIISLFNKRKEQNGTGSKDTITQIKHS